MALLTGVSEDDRSDEKIQQGHDNGLKQQPSLAERLVEDPSTSLGTHDEADPMQVDAELVQAFLERMLTLGDSLRSHFECKIVCRYRGN